MCIGICVMIVVLVLLMMVIGLGFGEYVSIGIIWNCDGVMNVCFMVVSGCSLDGLILVFLFVLCKVVVIGLLLVGLIILLGKVVWLVWWCNVEVCMVSSRLVLFGILLLFGLVFGLENSIRMVVLW